MFRYDRFNDRIQEIGITKAFIARSIDHNPTYLQNHQSDSRDFDLEETQIIAKCLWTTPEYLTGETDEKEIPRGIDVTEDEMELLSNYRLLTSIDKGRVLDRIETLLESDTYKQDIALSAG